MNRKNRLIKKLSTPFVSLAALLIITSCSTFQASDFEIMVRLPASEDCFALKVMSGKETRYPAAECAEIVKRAVILTSENWKMLKTDIQTNCQMNECTQITGAADGLFLAIDKALNKVPTP